MKILIAEDDAVSRRLIETTLINWGYDVVVAKNGTEAWQAFNADNVPQLAIIDWMMPGMEGVQICRRVREELMPNSCYILLLTSKNGREEVAEGLDSGADDYLIKPCDPIELRARLGVGLRVLGLQSRLVAKVTEVARCNTLTQTVHSLVPHIRQAIGPVIREAHDYSSSQERDGERLAQAALAGGLRIEAIADALSDMAIFGEVPTMGTFSGAPDGPKTLEALIGRYEDRRWCTPRLVD